MVTAFFFEIVFFFFLIVFTPLGDPFPHSGRKALLQSTADPGQHVKLAAMVESDQQTTIEACPAEFVDYIPCEDPKRNSQLSREMNFYRERHCSDPEEAPLCLIPPPKGYKMSVPWPESLHKIEARSLFARSGFWLKNALMPSSTESGGVCPQLRSKLQGPYHRPAIDSPIQVLT